MIRSAVFVCVPVLPFVACNYAHAGAVRLNSEFCLDLGIWHLANLVHRRSAATEFRGSAASGFPT
jgi:hypothetical protein